MLGNLNGMLGMLGLPSLEEFIDNNNKKQLRRIKKFKQKYIADSTWFDLYNNGEMR